MPKLNRENSEDAKRAIEFFLPNDRKRQKFINFLCDAISFADKIDPNNWNLNLDMNGRFLRFNTGHEYCIQINGTDLLILCDKTTLYNISNIEGIPVEFMGWNGKQNVFNQRYDNVPDALAKAKNSIGCWLSTSEDFTTYIDKFKSSNRDFIKTAMKTRIKPVMRRAHSKGALEYLFATFEDTDNQSLPEWRDVLDSEAAQLERAKKLSHKERMVELKKIDPKPKQIIVQQTVYLRSQLVVAEVLDRAKGQCEQCKQPAPFIRESDATPYLEVHHKTRLADGGHDTVDNAIALCPNCHRQTHYGQKQQIKVG